MKSIAKIICCSVALAWMYSATAEEEAAADQASTGETQVTQASPGAAADPAAGAGPAAAAPDDVVVPTPPAPRVTVMPYQDKVDRARVEQRLQDKATRTQKRSAEAEKDAAERAIQSQQGNPAQTTGQ